MILPVRRGGLDRQQRKYPFAQRKKMSRKEGEPQRLSPPLCGLAPLREINKKTLANKVACRGRAGTAPLREEKKRMSRKEGEPQRLSPPFAAWRLCERLIKKL